MSYPPPPPVSVKTPMKGIALAIVVAYLLSLVTMIIIAPYLLNLFPVKTQQIADEAITTNKIAAYAIPYNSTYSTAHISKSTFTYEDIDGMSVDITLERTSHLIIMFSTQTAINNVDKSILWQALINNGTGIWQVALPGEFYMQPGGLKVSMWTSLSYNWYQQDVAAGSYTIKIQWAVEEGATAWVRYRTLTVIALPA